MTTPDSDTRRANAQFPPLLTDRSTGRGVSLDLRRIGHLVVVGEPGSGRTSALSLAAANTVAGGATAVVCSAGGAGLEHLAGLHHLSLHQGLGQSIEGITASWHEMGTRYERVFDEDHRPVQTTLADLRVVVVDDLDLVQDAADTGDPAASAAVRHAQDILRMGRALNMHLVASVRPTSNVAVPLFFDTFTPVVLEPMAVNTPSIWLPRPSRRRPRLPIVYTGPGNRARTSHQPGWAKVVLDGEVRDVQVRYLPPDLARALVEEPHPAT
ncbi:hypothetical protein ACGF13_38465 [Kitasatospora sp. NPDC048286]|uniref:hypothetical protein n=1 Tax=Kitasatospora sp. NPDC048286 TaxID=3364047 RepID=UPI003712BAAF